jgi:hypothetical protein
MKARQRVILTGALTFLAAAGCSGSGQPPQPATSASGPSEFHAPPSSAPTAAGAADLSEFDSRFATTVEAAADVPLAGLSSTDAAGPTCRAIGDPASPARMCAAAFPAADPVVAISAIATGSMGATGMMMAMAAMPDGIQGTVLPAPALGDAASLSRSWGGRGCSAVLAVRDGTLIVSVQVRLATGPAASDCELETPTEYLVTVARSLLDNLSAFRAVGLPIDDRAARDRAVSLIVDGTLRPGDRDLVALPPEFASLSDTGEVVATRVGDDWTIVFFEVRGVVDHYSGWVFRSRGTLGANEDPLGGGSATVRRIDDHWFHVVAN